MTWNMGLSGTCEWNEKEQTGHKTNMADVVVVNIPLLISLLEDSDEESDDIGKETMTVLMEVASSL